MPNRRFIPVPSQPPDRPSGGMEPARLVPVDGGAPAFEFPFLPEVLHPIGGHGVWRTIDHDRWKQSTEYVGVSATRHELRFMFDARLQGRSIAADYRGITRLAQPVGGWPSGAEPPVVSFLPYGGVLRWVIESLEWDRATMWRDPATGQGLHMEGVVTLLEHRVPRIAATPVERAQPPAAAAAVAAPKTRTVRSGDWLSKIAKEEYGDPNLWTVIYEANKGTLRSGNPDLIFPGEVVTIPPKP